MQRQREKQHKGQHMKQREASYHRIGNTVLQSGRGKKKKRKCSLKKKNQASQGTAKLQEQ